jgi:hypothetical protein
MAACAGRESSPEALPPDAGTPDHGAFFCTAPSTYFVEVKTDGDVGVQLRLPCSDAGYGVTASLGAGFRAGMIVCAKDERGAQISVASVGVMRTPFVTEGKFAAVIAWWDGRDASTVIRTEGTMDVTYLGSIGDVIEGTYLVSSADSSPMAISGSFRACHVFDEFLAPPP